MLYKTISIFLYHAKKNKRIYLIAKNLTTYVSLKIGSSIVCKLLIFYTLII